jgi:hypothetical protein
MVFSDNQYLLRIDTHPPATVSYIISSKRIQEEHDDEDKSCGGARKVRPVFDGRDRAG